MSIVRTSAIALRCAMLVGLVGVAASAQAAVQVLLIGVSDYKEAGVSDLLGPPNDIALMKKVLIERFKVPSSQIAVVLNPNHTAVERAFADLAARVQPNDQVYLHVAGHGSVAAAPPPRPGEEAERRGEDQTWVVRGSRTNQVGDKDTMDVLDKEVALWLAPIYKLTPHVVVVSDSCHSATATRDVQWGARSADGTGKPHPLRATIQRVPDPTTGLRIGAARDFESAVEFDPNSQGRCTDARNCYGVFTWHWAAALQASRPGESWGDAFNRATAAITANPAVLQRPQMEGISDRAIFDGQFAPLSALVPVTAVQPVGTVLLGAGLLSGLTVGSEFAGTATAPAAVPRLQVTSVTAGGAEARLLSGKVKAGDVVQEVRHQSSERPIRLFVGGPQVANVDAGIAEQVRQAVEGARKLALQEVELVPQREQADWRLEIVRPKLDTPVRTAALPQSVECAAAPCTPPELWVVSPLGQLMDEKMRFPMADPPAQMPRLLSNLATFAHAREVRAIGTQGNNTPLQLQVSVLSPPGGGATSCVAGAKADSGWQRSAPTPLDSVNSKDVKLGDCLAFTLENRDLGKHWYGYIVAIDANFTVHAIWPPRGAMGDEARIEPHTTYPLTKSFYHLTDPGRESLLFVASETPVQVAGLVQSGMRSAETRGGSSSLARLLNAGTLTRGETETASGTSGAQLHDFDVPTAPR